METLPSAGVAAQTPHRLGPYRVDGLVGRGGVGVVYRATAPGGEHVAVKTVARPTPLALASLRAELHALRRVRHAGIVRVFDDGVDDGRPWFAMELLAGVTAADYRRRVTLALWTPDTLRPVMRFIADLCSPLAALHESGLVHRDLKPENVFVRGDGDPVIVDLGLARGYARGGSRAIAEADAVAGTYAYMAPEQLTNELIDARTDLYALGCMLFELLVGRPPAQVGSEPPSHHVHGVPPALDALVVSLLRPRPRDRIGHAEDVRAWLLALLEPSAARPVRPSPVQRLYRPVLSGRRELLRELSAGLDGAREGCGVMFVVEGDSGIGKTHLVSEIGRRAVHDCAVLPVPSERADGAPQAPLASWGEVFQAASDRARIAPASPIAAAISRHRDLLVGLHRSFAYLDTPGAARDTRPSPDKVLVAISDLVGALAEDQPIVLLLDDLQWADELTAAVVRLLAGPWLEHRRILLLATLRTDEAAVWAAPDLPRARRLVVGPLPDTDLRELIADMLGVGEPPESVVAWIARRAEGNPYLAAEYLRLLTAEVPLDRELALPVVRVRAPSAEVLEALPTPRTVHDLVMRRVDTLDADARRLAELVAVFGGSIDAEVVAVLEDEHRDALFELHRRQFLEQLPGGGRRLLHDRMRSVVYDQLAPAARVARHTDAAALLSRASAAAPPHGAIGRHLVLAGQRDAALPHLEQAAELALSRAAYDTAASHFDEARAIAAERARRGQLPPRDRRARLSLGAARASYGRGDMEACEDRVRDALALVGRKLPRGPGGWLGMIAREIVTQLGPARSSRSADPVVADVSLAASILPYRYYFDENLVPVIATALLSANLAQQGGVVANAAGPMSLLAAMAGLFRMPATARRYFGQAQQAARSVSDWRETAQAHALESIYHGSFARWEAAEVCAQRAVEYCIPANDPWLRVNAETTYAHVEYFTGRFADAHRRAVLTERLATERNNVQHAVWGHFLQARSDIPRGRWEAADRHLRDAFRQLSIQTEVISELACNGMFARVRYALGDHAEAEARATAVTERVKTRVAPAYTSMIGYLTASRVQCDLLAAESSPGRWERARTLALALWRFAAIFPVALPGAYLHTAQLLRIANARRVSHQIFMAGARRAEAWGQPYEHAHLLFGASRTAGDRTSSRALREAAAAISSRLDCHAQELEA